MEHTKISIIVNTLESMAADAEDHGRSTIHPMIPLEDIGIITKALNNFDKLGEKCKENRDENLPSLKVDELADTVAGMTSADYKERFKAEYKQTKIRYEKLKKFNTRIEAAGRTDYKPDGVRVPMPKHDCPDDMLIQQQRVMGEYLHILEVRAVIEGVEL
jgi:hypothetical protein